MSRIHRIRHSLRGLAGLAATRSASEQLAGDRRAARHRAGDLAMAGRRPLGVAGVLAAPLLFAGTANAIAAAGPAGNASVVSAWNAAAPDTALAAPLAGLPDGAAKTDGVAFGERAVRELTGLRAHGRNAPVQVTMPTSPGMRRPTPPTLAPPPALGSRRYPRAFIEWKLSARPPQQCGRSGLRPVARSESPGTG